MSQNVSSAVMAQRSEPHDSLDDFPTQPWATRALCEHVLVPIVGPIILRTTRAWEPACNRGHMAMPLTEYFGRVHSSDIFDYGYSAHEATCDFLFPGSEAALSLGQGARINWVVTNPPFRLAEEFILRSFQLKGWNGTAVIVRTAFLESVGRYQKLFRTNPPAIVAQFTERVPMVKGRLTATGSTATAYCWLVWTDAHLSMKDRDTRFMWIPPCRKILEKPEDYR